MSYFVIEHPTRGWYVGGEYENVSLKDGRRGYLYRPKFAWSIIVRDDRVKKMFSQREADSELKKIPQAVRIKCRIKEFK